MAEGAGVSFKDALSSTQGKIAIASGVAVVGWYYWRQKNAAASTTAASAATTSTAAYGDGSLDSSMDSGSGGSSGGYGGAFGDNPGSISSYPSGTTTSASNASWVQNALSYLESLGYNAQTAATALAGYTQGQSLTTAQQGLVTTALGGVGPAPVAVPITTTLSPPTGVTSTGSGTTTSTGSSTGTVGSSTPNTHTVTVAKGETQKEIIQAAGISYNTFLQDNPSFGSNGKSNGTKVTAGEKVKV